MMRKLLCLLIFIIVLTNTLILKAQSPKAFKYQAFARDSTGSLLVNRDVAVRITLVKDNPSGTAVYSETDNVNTGKFGQITLDLGKGNNQTGSFANVDWSSGVYFLKIEIDIDNGTNFRLMGTSQLLSVPYAFYADKTSGLPMLTDAERDSLKNPQKGDMIYNINTNCLNIFNGKNWFQTCEDSSNCVPKPSIANAGADQYYIQGTTAALSGNIPGHGTGQWSIATGTGGKFADSSKFNSSFTGIAGYTYVLRWTITTACDKSTDDMILSFLAASNCGTVADADGNIYNTVKIGAQCWTHENLRTTKYSDGTAIPYVPDNPAWEFLSTAGYSFNNTLDETGKKLYGAFYNWYAVETAKLCPTGWHVPTVAEWNALFVFLGSSTVAGDKMKDAGTLYWKNNKTTADNSSGFTALPAGCRWAADGTFPYFSTRAYWWTSSNQSTSTAWDSFIYGDYSWANAYGGNAKTYGYSVRCLKDN